MLYNVSTLYNKLVPINIVEFYLTSGFSLRKAASYFNIHYQTLYKWVKKYKKGEVEKLKSFYRRPWNRKDERLEEKIALMKEKNPSLSLRKAQKILLKQGIKISIKGIWSIWKRYGYAGFKKEKISVDFTSYIPWSLESKKKFEIAKSLFKQNKIKESTEILNSIPAIPKNELVIKIPDEYLNLKRKTEKLPYIFGKIPLHEYIEKIEKLKKELIKNKMYYTYLRVCIHEVIALSYTTDYRKGLNIIRECEKILYPNLFPLNYIFLTSKAICYLHLLKVKKATQILKKCERTLKTKKTRASFLKLGLSILYTHIEDYTKAYTLMSDIFDDVEGELKKRAQTTMLSIYFLMGKYREYLKNVREVGYYEWIKGSRPLIYKAFINILRGNVFKAMNILNSALKFSKEQQTRDIVHCDLIRACIYTLLGDKESRNKILREIISYLSKNKHRTMEIFIKYILKDIHVNRELFHISSFKLIKLIRENKYKQAYKFAKKKNVLTQFYRTVCLFPESAEKLIKNREHTYLPRPLLKLPAFNNHVFVFNIKFLGKLRIYRIIRQERNLKNISKNSINVKKERIKLQLTPKEKAFLIHLALKAYEPGKTIKLENIYKNFWAYSKNPSTNLSHTLSKIRKALKIPTHLLEIKHKGDYSVLKNNGIFFVTDLFQYREKISRTKSLLKLDEWEFAKKEFVNALNIVKGEPFKKMYDRWSEDTRLKIIFEIEKDIMEFINECKKRKETYLVKKINTKGRRIFRYSDKFTTQL